MNGQVAYRHLTIVTGDGRGPSDAAYLGRLSEFYEEWGRRSRLIAEYLREAGFTEAAEAAAVGVPVAEHMVVVLDRTLAALPEGA